MKPLLYALLPRPAHPTRDGGAIRSWFLLAALAEEFRVRAFVLRTPGSPAARECPPGVEPLELPQVGNVPRRATSAVRSLLEGKAYPELLYRSRSLERGLAEAARKEQPAWVVAHSYQLGATASAQAAASWIDFQNVDSEIWARLGRTASSPLVRWFARLQAPRVAALERRLVGAATGVSCASQRDAQSLSTASPAVPLVVPNGVDLSRYRFRAEPAAGKVLFFVGDLSWPPNAEGIRWFRARVWPLLRERDPEARVEVLGRGAPADLVSLGAPDFRFLGEGDDTRPHWERAAVSIVPLQAAGGTRLKILEAAACGVPVVSTPVGAEGLDLEQAKEIAIGADAAAFADEAARLLADPEARRRQAAAARRKVDSLYDWRSIGAAFAKELRRRSGAA
jgi:polysaccharide biosynthesis protein PslH